MSRVAPAFVAQTVRVSEVIAGLSRALDLTEGHPHGHAARSCIIGMRIARGSAFPRSSRSDLFYALLLKDAGCSSNAARVTSCSAATIRRSSARCGCATGGSCREKAPTPEYTGRGGRWSSGCGAWRCSRPRAARRRASCSRSAATAAPTIALDARLVEGDRRGDPQHGRALGRWRLPAGLRGDRFRCCPHRRPGAGRDLLRTVGVEVARSRSRSGVGRWFDPAIVEVSLPLFRRSRILGGTAAPGPDGDGRRRNRVRSHVRADDVALDRIAEAFASVIDAKSPFTSDHSPAWSRIAETVGKRCGSTTGPGAPAPGRAAARHRQARRAQPDSRQAGPAWRRRVDDRPPPSAAHLRHPAGSAALQGFRRGRQPPSREAERSRLSLRHLRNRPVADRPRAGRCRYCRRAARRPPYRAGLGIAAAAGILQRECAEGALCGTTVRAMVGSLAEPAAV